MFYATRACGCSRLAGRTQSTEHGLIAIGYIGPTSGVAIASKGRQPPGGAPTTQGRPTPCRRRHRNRQSQYRHCPRRRSRNSAELTYALVATGCVAFNRSWTNTFPSSRTKTPPHVQAARTSRLQVISTRSDFFFFGAQCRRYGSPPRV